MKLGGRWVGRLLLVSISVLFGSVTGFAGSVIGEPPPEDQTALTCTGEDPADTATIETATVALGDMAIVRVHVQNTDSLRGYELSFTLPENLGYEPGIDTVIAGPGVPEPDITGGISYNSTTRQLTVSHLTAGPLFPPPGMNDVFLELHLSTHCMSQHGVTLPLTWGPDAWLSTKDCVADNILSLTDGAIVIDPISITFDISEETALVGDIIDVTVNCTNSYSFDEFLHAWVQYDPNILSPVYPYVIETGRTTGGLDQPLLFGPWIKVSGSKAGGYGTSAADGPAFYKLRFQVISPVDNDTGLVFWHPYYLFTYGMDCHQNLDSLIPPPVHHADGSVTVPPYRALFDFGDTAWNNQSLCEVRVPIRLRNNYPLNNFSLVVNYSDNFLAPLEFVRVESSDPLIPLSGMDRSCGTDQYAWIQTTSSASIDTSSALRTVGWMVFQNRWDVPVPLTHALQLSDCADYGDSTWVETHDVVRLTTRYRLADPQVDGDSGVITEDNPLAQVSVPSAQARWRKTGGRPGYYEGFAYSGVYAKSNADLDSVWFTLSWDASRFCVRFSEVSRFAHIVTGNGTAYIRVDSLKTSALYQKFATIRVDNNYGTNQSGGWTISNDSAQGACAIGPVTTTGVGGSIFLGPGGSTACAISQPSENLMKLSNVPERFELLQNYPNPFNASTVINFDLAAPGQTTLEIYNIMGQLVAKPFDSYTEAGRYSIRWDGRDERGQTAASGVYLYRLQSGTMIATKKMVILK